jgi:flagellar assembly protein FliH
MSCKLVDPGSTDQAGPFPWFEVVGVALSPHGALRRTTGKGDAPDSAQSRQSATLITSSESEESPEAAMRQAYAEGAAAARSEAEAEFRPVLERLAAGIASLAGARAKVRREAESDLVKLSISIARRLLHRELSIDPESVQALVRVAIEKISVSELVRVRVHPTHRELVEKALDRCTAGRALELVADPSLLPGDLVYETTRGALDARIDSQLDEIERGFADRLRRG